MIVDGVHTLLRNKHFYIGLFILYFGIQVNLFSQEYLHNFIKYGNVLPSLSDLILNNLPYWDIDYLYDIFSVIALVIFVIYVIHSCEYQRVPYFLTLCGIFMFVRGVFVVLTPFGQPPEFDGTEGLFKGFSKFELGVYPSGHTGISYMYFLLARDTLYKLLILGCLVITILSLFFSRGHYSIDVLSGLFFAYAIKSFGDKHLLKLLIN